MAFTACCTSLRRDVNQTINVEPQLTLCCRLLAHLRFPKQGCWGPLRQCRRNAGGCRGNVAATRSSPNHAAEEKRKEFQSAGSANWLSSGA